MRGEGCKLRSRRYVLQLDPVGEHTQERNRLIDRQMRGEVRVRCDGHVQAGVEPEPQQHAADHIDPVAGDDAQVVAGAVGEARRKSDLQMPRRALGGPLAIATLQLTVRADRHGDRAVGADDRARR